MAKRKQKPVAKRTEAESVLHDHEREIAEIVGDRFEVLTNALRDLRTMREGEAALRQELERLMTESVANDLVKEHLWQALFDLRQWHKEEYQSSRRIDAQADAALDLFLPADRGRRPN